MPVLDFQIDGAGGWPDLVTRDVVVGHWTRLAALPGGMESGAPSVAIVVELPDGRPCFAETSFALLYTAVLAIAARYGVPP